MRILFIGGSNFVIKTGVVSTLPGYLSESLGQDIVETKNISVGGTGSLFGLHNLLELSDTQRFDFVFIEYGINDYGPYKRNPILWEAGFTTLLKTVRSKCPRAKIVVLLLGRRERQFFNIQNTLHSEMRRISSVLDATVVDADALFKSGKIGKFDFKSIYIDGTHYRPPLATNLISTYTAMQAVGTKVNSPIFEKNDLLNKLKDHVFETYNFSEKTDDKRKILEFKNSLFEIKTETIPKGEEFRLKTPLRPCALAFISTKSTGSILINVNNQKAILHCVHRRVLNGDFSFLIRHTPLFWLNFDASASQESRQFDTKIRLIDSTDPEWDQNIIQQGYEMIPVKPGTAKSVHLVSMTLIE